MPADVPNNIRTGGKARECARVQLHSAHRIQYVDSLHSMRTIPIKRVQPDLPRCSGDIYINHERVRAVPNRSQPIGRRIFLQAIHILRRGQPRVWQLSAQRDLRISRRIRRVGGNHRSIGSVRSFPCTVSGRIQAHKACCRIATWWIQIHSSRGRQRTTRRRDCHRLIGRNKRRRRVKPRRRDRPLTADRPCRR